MAVLKPTPFASLLKRYRVRAGLTQEELAERARLSVRGISDLERSVNLSPRDVTVNQIADALELQEMERARLASAARGLVPMGQQIAGFERGAAIHAGAPLLVGRSDDLEAIRQHFVGAGAPILMFAGEPGIGKSSLLRYAAAQARESGFTVLSGGCQRSSGQQPFAPVAEALLDFAEGQTGTRLRAALRGCTWITRLLPELADVLRTPSPVSDLGSGSERRAVFSSVVRFLKNAAGPDGIALLLDDLQWAGADALELLAQIVRAAPDIPLLVTGAYRTTEVHAQHPLSFLLGDLAQAQLVMHRQLFPLEPAHAATLLRELTPDIPPETERILLDKSGGVPFFLVSWAVGLKRQGFTDRPTYRLPWTLAQSIRQRVAALTPKTREVLGTAAVIGREVPLTLLCGSQQASEAVVLAALDEAQQASLVVETDGLLFRFAHDVVREVIEDDLGVGRRMMLHRQVGKTLERLSGVDNGKAAALAFHFLEGNSPHLALRYAMLTGEQAETAFAHEQAEQHYRTARELAQRTGDRAEEIRALERLGVVLTTTSRWPEALNFLDEAATICDVLGDRESRDRIIARIAWAHLERGTPLDGIGRIETILAGSEGVPSSIGRAELYSVLADLYAQQCRHLESFLAVQRAAELATAAPESTERARTLAGIELRRGRALLSLNRVQEGMNALERTIPLAEAARDLYVVNRAYNNMGYVHAARANYRESQTCFRHALNVIEPLGDPLNIGITLSNLNDAHMVLGEWKEARVTTQLSAEAIGAAGSSRFSSIPPLDLGRLLYYLGEYEQAERVLDQGIQLSEASQRFPSLWEGFWLQEGVRARAELDLRRGRAAEAADRLKNFLSAASWLSAEEAEAQACTVIPVLATAQLQSGEVEQAWQLLDRAFERLSGSDDDVRIADILLARGAVHAHRKEYGAAVQALDRAASLAASVPFPYLQARSLMSWARVLRNTGDVSGAQSRFMQALQIFERLEARKDVETAQQELDECAGSDGSGTSAHS